MMTVVRRYWVVLALAATVLIASALVGCGSGGGSTSAGGSQSGIGGGGNSGVMDIYVTDGAGGFRNTYSQVLVTLYQIQATSDGKTWQTLFSDTNGITLNLVSFSSVAELIDSATIPAGTYTQVRVVIGDHITLVPKGGGSSINAPVASASNISVANGQAVITFNAPTTVPKGQNTNLVVDFNLGGFTLQNGKVVPDVTLAPAPNFLTMSHTAQIAGTVSNLSSNGFTLTTKHGATFAVTLPGTATIANALWSPTEQCGAPATLANGDVVGVKGALTPASRTIAATEVFVHVDSFITNHGHLTGTIASVDTTNKTFTVTVTEAVHIQPSSGTVTITTDQNTILHNGFGNQPNLAFSDLKQGQTVDIAGAFDTTTDSILACRIDILPSSP